MFYEHGETKIQQTVVGLKVWFNNDRSRYARTALAVEPINIKFASIKQQSK